MIFLHFIERDLVIHSQSLFTSLMHLVHHIHTCMFTGIDPHGELYLHFLHNRLTVVLHFALGGPVHMDRGHNDHTALVAGLYIPTAVACGHVGR